MSALPTVYTLEELNEAYGWSVDTLRDYIHSRELPASRVGRKFVVTPEGLAEFLKRRAVNGDD